MSFQESTSLYDILDIKPDASPQEIREAYLRTKAAYGKDSVALYTLITADERERMLAQIQEAYEILSNSDKRRDYDRHHGLLSHGEDTLGAMEAAAPTRAPAHHKIISIDRVAPMESSANSEALLVAPTTDFTEGAASIPPGSPAGLASGSTHSTTLQPTSPPTSASQPIFNSSSAIPSAASGSAPGAGLGKSSIPPTSKPADHALNQEIAQEVEWKGPFLRRVREGRRMSIEELSNITKVSKTYLQAIEEENFAKLPAPVFLRGFITQMAKTLRLPHEQVVSAYMARFLQSKPDKTGR